MRIVSAGKIWNFMTGKDDSRRSEDLSKEFVETVDRFPRQPIAWRSHRKQGSGRTLDNATTRRNPPPQQSLPAPTIPQETPPRHTRESPGDMGPPRRFPRSAQGIDLRAVGPQRCRQDHAPQDPFVPRPPLRGKSKRG